MIFTPVPVERVRTHWPWVRFCLNDLIEKAGADEWLPEDVYRELMEGRVTLILVDGDDGESLGFMVCQVGHDVTGRYLSVWIIYAPGFGVANAGEWMDFLRSTAHRQSCYKIEGGSFRKGWEPILKSLGFRPITTWELILPERTDEEAKAA